VPPHHLLHLLFNEYIDTKCGPNLVFVLEGLNSYDQVKERFFDTCSI
jgi:hypothetical protein